MALYLLIKLRNRKNYQIITFLNTIYYLEVLHVALIIIVFYLSGASNSSTADKVPEEVMRSLKFIRATAAWKSNAQYLLEIELNEAGEYFKTVIFCEIIFLI